MDNCYHSFASFFFSEIKFEVFEKLYKYVEENHFNGLFGKTDYKQL